MNKGWLKDVQKYEAEIERLRAELDQIGSKMDQAAVHYGDVIRSQQDRIAELEKALSDIASAGRPYRITAEQALDAVKDKP